MKSKKILLLGHPEYTLPAYIDTNSGGVVIDSTLKKIPYGYTVWNISPYKDEVENYKINKTIYRHFDKNNFCHKLVKKIIERFSLIRNFNNLTNPYKNFLVAIIIEYILKRPNIIIVHTTKLPWASLLKTIFKRCKILLYQHNSELDSEFEKELYQLEGLAGHIFVSQFAKKKLLQKIEPNKALYTKHSRISRVIKNGINTDLFKPLTQNEQSTFRSRLKIPTDSFVIVFCGRLIERKGVHLLIDAFINIKKDTHSNLTLVLIGSDYIKSLNDKIRSSNTEKDNIIFTGVIKNKETCNYYGMSDLLVFPSIDLEGLPLVPLEAQACGIPVIANKIGGASECVLDGESGFLIDEIREDSLEKKIREFMNKSNNERTKMKESARAFILHDFSEQIMSNTFYSTIEELNL
jgi:glycosyltransferase involved in cell wall biosynthesis